MHGAVPPQASMLAQQRNPDLTRPHGRREWDMNSSISKKGAQKDFGWRFLQPRKKKHIMVTMAGVRQNYEDLVNPWAAITIRGIFISCKYLKLSSRRIIIRIDRINWRPSEHVRSSWPQQAWKGDRGYGLLFSFLLPIPLPSFFSFSSSFIFFLSISFWDRVSCRYWQCTHYVAQADLELPDSFASTPWVLGL